ncbi:beta-ketoacyl synthase N-terminal-like domain-containing protein, partial [Cetobacterium sp.]
MRRVVVTGVGLITSLGTGTEKSWDAIKAGKCGINEIKSFDTTESAVKIAG